MTPNLTVTFQDPERDIAAALGRRASEAASLNVSPKPDYVPGGPAAQA